MAEILKVYDLYCDGEKIGSSLFKQEVAEMKREYTKWYEDLGQPKPKFKTIEV